MKSERIIADDPVAKAREMIERGFPADKITLLSVYSGTLAQAKQIRKLLDEANITNVQLTFGLSTIVDSSIKPPPSRGSEKLKNMSPEARAMIKDLWNSALKEAKSEVKKVKEYEPASYGHVMVFYYDGENTAWAANAQVTEFTTDLQQAYVGSRTRIMAMYEHVNRRVRGIKKIRTYKLDGEKLNTDNYFVWDNMYCSRQVHVDSDGVRYENNNDFQEAMRAKDC